jgi:serine protease
VFDATLAATKNGFVVVAAAGNGAVNLDAATCNKKFDKSQGDSGAIMVGAGAPFIEGYTARSRLLFSSYGSRVDVQGWGRNVFTLGYGDLHNDSDLRNANRNYTYTFSGTSSASAIVAGAAVLVQSYAQNQWGERLGSGIMRQTS